MKKERSQLRVIECLDVAIIEGAIRSDLHARVLPELPSLTGLGTEVSSNISAITHTTSSQCQNQSACITRHEINDPTVKTCEDWELEVLSINMRIESC